MSDSKTNIQQKIDQIKTLRLDIERLAGAFNQASARYFAQAVDIHQHTRSIGVFYQEQVLPLDNKYGITPILTESNQASEYQKICGEILERTPQDRRADMQRVLENFGFDSETGLNTRDLLSKIWFLVARSLRCRYLLQSIGFQTDEMPTEQFFTPEQYVIQVLLHNITTGGGCKPGINARLVQPYAAMLLEHLKILKREKENELNAQLEPASLPTPERQIGVDSDLARALALSRSQESARKSSEESDLIDPNVRLAMRLSFQTAYNHQSKTETKQSDNYDQQLAALLESGMSFEDAEALLRTELNASGRSNQGRFC